MASGDTLAVFFPQDGEPPSSNYATLNTRTTTGAAALVLDYDDTTDESMDFAGFMPRHYGSGGVTATIGWIAYTAAGGVSLDMSFLALAADSDNLHTASFASANNTAGTAASAVGQISYTTIAFTDGADMDSVAAGSLFRMRLTRDADGTTSTDDMVGDLELLFVEIKET